MKDIFAGLYNKIVGFFSNIEQKEADESKNVARNRLKLVLMQDRTNLNPYLLERMRGELIDLLSKYVEMDKDALELNFDQEGDQMALMLSIPVIRAKDEKEIEEAHKAEDEAEESDEDLESEEDDNSEEEKEEETSSEDEENDSEDNQENSDEVEISEEKSEEIDNEEQEQNQE